VIIVDTDTLMRDVIKIAEIVPWAYFFYTDWPETKFHEQKGELGTWKSKFVESIQGECEYAAMTRLDNDDAINKNFMDIVKNSLSSLEDPHNHVVDFLNGCFYEEKTGRCFRCRHPIGSPFITYVERVSPKMGTVYRDCHRSMVVTSRKMPVRIISNIGAQCEWLEVIHDNNKSNRVIEEMVVGECDWNSTKAQFGL
jgi:DNA-directed RNA polymerase subunit N (RpoN/RPB10)